MNNQFISREEINEVQAANKCGVKAALAIIAPWASKVVRVCGGYKAFESLTDYATWRNQK